MRVQLTIRRLMLVVALAALVIAAAELTYRLREALPPAPWTWRITLP